MQNFFELASLLSEGIEKCLHSSKVLKVRSHKEWSPEWRAEIEGARGIVGMIAELHARASRAVVRSPISIKEICLVITWPYTARLSAAQGTNVQSHTF